MPTTLILTQPTAQQWTELSNICAYRVATIRARQEMWRTKTPTRAVRDQLAALHDDLTQALRLHELCQTNADASTP